jgi:hypothetical protein
MSFSLDVSKFAETTGRQIQEVHNLLTIDVFNKIIIATPVDTGRLRGNWFPSQLDINFQPRLNEDPSGASATNNIQQTFAKSKTYRHFLKNPLPYAPVVEFGLYPNPPKTPALRQQPPGKTKNGFSTQAPKGMVRVTLAAFETALNKAVNKAKAIK